MNGGKEENSNNERMEMGGLHWKRVKYEGFGISIIRI